MLWLPQKTNQFQVDFCQAQPSFNLSLAEVVILSINPTTHPPLSRQVVLKGLCHNRTFWCHKMLFCILYHMEAMIISYSTYIYENFRFWPIPEVNPSLKTRFPDENIIMKISFQTEKFAQNWLPDVIFCWKKVSGQFRPAISFESQFSSGNHFWAKNYVR